MRKKKKRPIGRPTDYRPEFVEQAFTQCLAGATDEDLANYFGVAESCLNVWKHKHPEFKESLRRGKEDAVGSVAKALYVTAMGGDVQAQKYFLNNRGKHWRNDPETMQTINNNTLQLPLEIIEAANKARKERLG